MNPCDRVDSYSDWDFSYKYLMMMTVSHRAERERRMTAEIGGSQFAADEHDEMYDIGDRERQASEPAGKGVIT